MAGFDLIRCIVRIGDSSKVIRIASKHGLDSGSISLARGTAHGHLLEFLKITDVRKEIVTMIAKSENSKEIVRCISEEMEFNKPHHGIVFSQTISELVRIKKNIHEISEVREDNDAMYKAIYVIVEIGKADDVIAAAKKAGARGGTILHARESGLHETQKFFSIEVEPEVEQAFLIVDSAAKDTIIEAIRTYLDANEDGKGLIFVLDINEAYGLHVD